jgi:hypothetical protein
MGTYRLKAILMDDNTSGYFEDNGLAGVRKANDRNEANYEFVDYDFKTEAERKAYIQALYDMSMGCWTQYAILDNRCRNF